MEVKDFEEKTTFPLHTKNAAGVKEKSGTDLYHAGVKGLNIHCVVHELFPHVLPLFPVVCKIVCPFVCYYLSLYSINHNFP